MTISTSTTDRMLWRMLIRHVVKTPDKKRSSIGRMVKKAKKKSIFGLPLILRQLNWHGFGGVFVISFSGEVGKAGFLHIPKTFRGNKHISLQLEFELSSPKNFTPFSTTFGNSTNKKHLFFFLYLKQKGRLR